MIGLEVKPALVWLRDQFAAWFTGSFIMLAVFFAIMSSVGVGVIWDGYFAKSLSPNQELQTSFQVAGYVISAMAILCVSVGVKACLDGAKIAGTVFIVAGVLAAIASWSQSIGVMSIAIEEKYEVAKSLEDAEADIELSNTNYLDELKAQRDDAMTARDAGVKQLEATIKDIRDDGVDGVGSGDLREIARLQDRIEKIRISSEEEIKRLNAEIKAELSGKREVVTNTSAQTEVGVQQKFNPLFPLFASFRYGPNPTDEQIREVAVGFSVFWAALIPAFGMLISVYLVITRHAARKREDLQAEIERKARRMAAARKAAETRKENANTFDAEYEEPEPIPITYENEDVDIDPDESDDDSEGPDQASRRSAA